MSDIDSRNAFEIYHILRCPITPEILNRAYLKGMIPKEDLVDGKDYIGKCRNASSAQWDAANKKFVYTRTKFSDSYLESLPHPEDDEGHDIFVPVKEA